MNTVGKIFVMLIFVMSLMFMSFVIAVYMTHTNWREKVTAPNTGYADRLKAANAENQALKEQIAELETQYDSELQLKQNTIANLEQKRTSLEGQLAQQSKDLHDLQTEQQGYVAAMQASEMRQEGQREQIDDNRVELREARLQRDTSFDQVVQLTDQLHALQLQFGALKERQRTLGEDYADAMAVLRKFDLMAEPERYVDVPPRVEGVVLAVRPDGLLEVSIGSDEWLLKGHALQVYRIANDQSVYLGKVEVLELEPDKAVCKILPEFRKGTIKRGDHVASRLD